MHLFCDYNISTSAILFSGSNKYEFLIYDVNVLCLFPYPLEERYAGRIITFQRAGFFHRMSPRFPLTLGERNTQN